MGLEQMVAVVEGRMLRLVLVDERPGGRHAAPLEDGHRHDVDHVAVGHPVGQRHAHVAMAHALGLDRPARSIGEGVGADDQGVEQHLGSSVRQFVRSTGVFPAVHTSFSSTGHRFWKGTMLMWKMASISWMRPSITRKRSTMWVVAPLASSR